MSIGKVNDGSLAGFNRPFELGSFDGTISGRPLQTGCGYFGHSDDFRSVTCSGPATSEFQPKIQGERV